MAAGVGRCRDSAGGGLEQGRGHGDGEKQAGVRGV